MRSITPMGGVLMIGFSGARAAAAANVSCVLMFEVTAF
jgi:hypothetical protein